VSQYRVSAENHINLWFTAVCCSIVLQSAALCCSVLQCVPMLCVGFFEFVMINLLGPYTNVYI